MSGETTSNFALELVQMAKAVEELPRVRQELEIAQARVEDYARAVQAREETILRLKQELDQSNSKTQQAEVDRDEAVRAFLEADDRTEKALAFVRTIMGNAESLMAAVEPPKPEPQANPTSPATTSEGSATSTAEVSGTVPQEAGSSGGTGEAPEVSASMVLHPPGVSDIGKAPMQFREAQGERAADPTSNVGSAPTPTSPTESSGGDTSASTAGSGSTEASPGVSVSDYPTSVTTPTATLENVAASAPEAVAASPSEDVGYHNEPQPADHKERTHSEWNVWYEWANRMDAKYGVHKWPARHAVA